MSQQSNQPEDLRVTKTQLNLMGAMARRAKLERVELYEIIISVTGAASIHTMTCAQAADVIAAIKAKGQWDPDDRGMQALAVEIETEIQAKLKEVM